MLGVILEQGMGDFMHDLMKMMDNNKVSAEVRYFANFGF